MMALVLSVACASIGLLLQYDELAKLMLFTFPYLSVLLHVSYMRHLGNLLDKERVDDRKS